MTTPFALRALTLASLAVLMGSPALAQEAYNYGGLSVGQSRAKLDEAAITNNIAGPGLTITSIERSQNDTAYKLYLGRQFNRFFALEGGYFHLGKFEFDATTAAPAGTLHGQLKSQGLNVDALGFVPMTDRFSAFARLGVTYAKTRDAFNSTGALVVGNPNPEKTKTNAKLGLGFQYAFTPSVLLRGEAERYRMNDAAGHNARVNVFSLGLIFPFGRTPLAAPRQAVAAPAYVAPAPLVMAPAPAPAPVVAAAPPAPVVMTPAPRRRVSYSAESLFTFDQSAVRPAGEAKLDTFAQELNGSQFETVSVEGHTDRLGAPAYNQTLSLQRAEAVKRYLVTSGKVDPNKINAVGKGETDPVTSPGDCKGNRPSPALIACLQADRRVEIEVVGTR